ncbi:SLBB domain-containing protein [Gloeocapsa sp. PCC 73106]|uniref:SLBB domain-containing protein n=1 Tax=Gloeocapsa sp. PCC 73106 TaxID=102232 RepID=UPI0002AC39EC|nr:SLBB domain-containing protein [Gloeocapsa sp. PCC 73106]ELR99347.1 periplasmic protein involved in polysaccharide export [Gloeocapsa sp. PCC 73106]
MNNQNWRLSTLTPWMILCVPLLGLTIEVQAQQLNQNQVQAATLNEGDYVLGAGDQIRLDIFQVTEYSGEYLVLVDGSITLPLVGRMQVSGLTLTQMSEQVSQAYADYLKRPLVTVSLISPRPLKMSISGEVASPGSYGVSFAEKQQFPSLTDLIKMAGGLTTLADLTNIEIRRQGETKEQILTVNLWELVNEGNLSQDISLRDGDQVIIPSKTAVDPRESRQLANVNFGIQARESLDITIIGEVYRPGTYEVEPKTDEESGAGDPPSLTTAIAKAGGIKPLADIRQIEIHRSTYDGNQQTLTVDLWQLLQQGDINQDIILQEGDKIVIPTAQELDPEEAAALAEASFAPDTIEVKVVGEVKTPGAVKIPPNTPLNQAILAAGGFNQGRAKDSAVELIRLNPDGTVSKRSIDIDFDENLSEDSNPPLRQNDVIVVHTTGGARALDTMGVLLSPLRAIPFLR